jgi:predicted Zn-dependent protease
MSGTQSKSGLFGAPHCVVALACLLAVVGCGGAASRFTSHMQRGQSYFDKGDYVHASIEFRNAMQIAPKDVNARIMSARVNEKLSKPREAAALYQSVLDEAPDNTQARANLGRIFAFAGLPQRALETVEPGLAKHPSEVSLLVVRAVARMQLKNMAGAQADADRALQLDPNDEDAIGLRVGLYKQAGDGQHALALLSDAVARLPRSAQLREVLAQLYMSADDPAKAEEQLRSVIQLEPQQQNHRKTLAIFYVRGHRLDDAQRVLEQSVKDFPASDDTKLTLADFLATRRTPAAGAQALRDFIARNPDDYELRFGLAEMLQRNGSNEAALGAYNEIIKRDGLGPSGLRARDRVAALDVVAGRSDDARKLIQEVLKKSPRDTDALLVQAQIELERNDPANAIADLRAVLRDQPRSVPVQRMIARAYVANGDPALAEQALRAAMDVAPGDTGVRIELARLLAQTQRPEQAVTLLEQTVLQEPSNADVREVLVQAYLGKKDFVAASAAARDLETLRPKAGIGPYLAGLAAQGQNQVDEARKQFRHAYELQPDVPEPLSALAQLELRQGNAAQALAVVKAAAEANPNNTSTANLLGEVYIATHDFPHAIEALSRAISSTPTWWPPYRNLALAKLAAGDPKGAITAYEGGVKVAPTAPQLVTELARLYEQQGRVDDAITLYEATYNRDPHMQVVANNLAMMLVTYKNDRRSLDRARDLTAAFVSSTSSALLDTNGWVRFKRGEYADALPVLERAAHESPDAKEIRYHLGMTELHAGQNERARSDLEAAVANGDKYPWSQDARNVLASLKAPTG